MSTLNKTPPCDLNHHPYAFDFNYLRGSRGVTYEIIEELPTTSRTAQRKALVTYECDGFQKIFSFAFDYLRKSFVKVRIGQTVLTYGIDYTVTSKQINFVNPPPRDTQIVIYRETTTKRLVAWEDASVLRASEMTLFETQLLHVLEETIDSILETCLTLDTTDSTWDAQLRRIKNLATPVNPYDAVNKQYIDEAQQALHELFEELREDIYNKKDGVDAILQKIMELVSSVSVTLNPIILSINEPLSFDEHTVWFKNVGNTLNISGHDIMFVEI